MGKTGLERQRALSGTQEKKRRVSSFEEEVRNPGLQGCSEIMQEEN